MIGVVTTVLGFCLAALVLLWIAAPHSVLDIWLMVVLCAWVFDIALSALLNVDRFDLGFYLGRIYGLFAASFVLAVLLVDNVGLQAQLSRLLAIVRQQAASEKNLRTERERLFSAVVESSNDAIITKTVGGTITAWNRAAERLFGFTSTEAVGKHIDIIVPLDRRAELRGILERVGRGEVIEQYETLHVHRDGHSVEVSLSISPIRSVAGEIIGVSETARDITESKRTQTALNQEIEERRRIFETSQDLILVTDTAGKFHPGQPEPKTILGYRGIRNDRPERSGIHPSRRSRQHAQRDAFGAPRTANAQLRDPLYPQGRAGGNAELDGNVVGAGAAPFLHRPRPDRKAGRGSANPPCPEDGRDRPTDGRRRSRLQQHPDRDHRDHRNPRKRPSPTSPSSWPSPS